MEHHWLLAGAFLAGLVMLLLYLRSKFRRVTACSSSSILSLIANCAGICQLSHEECNPEDDRAKLFIGIGVTVVEVDGVSARGASYTNRARYS